MKTLITVLSIIGLISSLAAESKYPVYPKDAIVLSGEFKSILDCKVVQSEDMKTLTMKYVLDARLSDYKGDLASREGRNWYVYQCMQPMVEEGLASLDDLKKKWGDDHPNLVAYDAILKHLRAGGILRFHVRGKDGFTIANLPTTLIEYKSLYVEGVHKFAR